jgi:hypothetical protein
MVKNPNTTNLMKKTKKQLIGSIKVKQIYLYAKKNDKGYCKG